MSGGRIEPISLSKKKRVGDRDLGATGSTNSILWWYQMGKDDRKTGQLAARTYGRGPIGMLISVGNTVASDVEAHRDYPPLFK